MHTMIYTAVAMEKFEYTKTQNVNYIFIKFTDDILKKNRQCFLIAIYLQAKLQENLPDVIILTKIKGVLK